MKNKIRKKSNGNIWYDMKLECCRYNRIYIKNVIKKINNKENNVVHIWWCYIYFYLLT